MDKTKVQKQFFPDFQNDILSTVNYHSRSPLRSPTSNKSVFISPNIVKVNRPSRESYSSLLNDLFSSDFEEPRSILKTKSPKYVSSSNYPHTQNPFTKYLSPTVSPYITSLALEVGSHKNVSNFESWKSFIIVFIIFFLTCVSIVLTCSF